jgi:hypothetical protein
MAMAPADRAVALGMIHDLNNALGVVVNYACVVARDLEDRPTAARNMNEVASAGQRAVELVAQLSDLVQRPSDRSTSNDPR